MAIKSERIDCGLRRVRGFNCIYGLVSNSTNKLFYVGMTVNPHRRFICHRTKLNRSIGLNFRMEVLQEGKDVGPYDERLWIERAIAAGAKLINKVKVGGSPLTEKDFHRRTLLIVDVDMKISILRLAEEETA